MKKVGLFLLMIVSSQAALAIGVTVINHIAGQNIQIMPQCAGNGIFVADKHYFKTGIHALKCLSVLYNNIMVNYDLTPYTLRGAGNIVVHILPKVTCRDLTNGNTDYCISIEGHKELIKTKSNQVNTVVEGRVLGAARR